MNHVCINRQKKCILQFTVVCEMIEHERAWARVHVHACMVCGCWCACVDACICNWRTITFTMVSSTWPSYVRPYVCMVRERVFVCACTCACVLSILALIRWAEYMFESFICVMHGWQNLHILIGPHHFYTYVYITARLHDTLTSGYFS